MPRPGVPGSPAGFGEVRQVLLQVSQDAVPDVGIRQGETKEEKGQARGGVLMGVTRSGGPAPDRRRWPSTPE
jgi:hypothetical protein